ncbi:hypothetical protein D3C85_1914410 [compost metagenome]
MLTKGVTAADFDFSTGEITQFTELLFRKGDEIVGLFNVGVEDGSLLGEIDAFGGSSK